VDVRFLRPAGVSLPTQLRLGLPAAAPATDPAQPAGHAHDAGVDERAWMLAGAGWPRQRALTRSAGCPLRRDPQHAGSGVDAPGNRTERVCSAVEDMPAGRSSQHSCKRQTHPMHLALVALAPDVVRRRRYARRKTCCRRACQSDCRASTYTLSAPAAAHSSGGTLEQASALGRRAPAPIPACPASRVTLEAQRGCCGESR
jgi:hypothetical protein